MEYYDSFKKMNKKIDASIKMFKEQPRIINLAKVFENYQTYEKAHHKFVESDWDNCSSDEKTICGALGIQIDKKIAELKDFCADARFGTKLVKAYELLEYDY